MREMLKMRVETQRGTSRRAAQFRRRLFKTGCGLFVLAAVIACGWSLIHKAFYDNPEFMLKHVEIGTDGRLTKQEILTTAQVPATINLLKIDIASIDTRLRERSQVKDVRVNRKVPDTLEIAVWEREPVAWLGYRGGGYDRGEKGVLLDAEGYAIFCHTIYNEFFELPVILVSQDKFSNAVTFGDRLELKPVHAALKLLGQWPDRSPDPRLRIAQINADREYRLDVDFESRLRVIFAPKSFAGQIVKLKDALRHAEYQNRHLAQVDLTVADNIPVIYHQDDFSPQALQPSQHQHQERPLRSPTFAPAPAPAPGWQAPEQPSNNHLSDEELNAILRVDP